MPIIESQYKPKFLFKKGHFSTIYSGLIRKVNTVDQKRERISLSDGDFLDLDWSYADTPTDTLIIVLHGLEGDAKRPYMLGTAALFNENGIDAVCVNFRGCGGEDNKLYRSYHSGATEDLLDVINYVISQKTYEKLLIKGFSLGGNLLLKYLGEGHDVPEQVKGAVAVSVPCYLKGSCDELHTFKNVLDANRFKRHLLDRLRKKLKNHPQQLSDQALKTIKTLYDFDNVYTSVAHGFKDADDYYEQCSSLQFLPNIKVPSLLINALNDSFLSAECFPVKEAKANSFLHLEMPKYGGHVGFYQRGPYYYNEFRALEFLKGLL